MTKVFCVISLSKNLENRLPYIFIYLFIYFSIIAKNIQIGLSVLKTSAITLSRLTFKATV